MAAAVVDAHPDAMRQVAAELEHAAEVVELVALAEGAHGWGVLITLQYGDRLLANGLDELLAPSAQLVRAEVCLCHDGFHSNERRAGERPSMRYFDSVPVRS